MEDPFYRELMNYAMRTLARRAHTVQELRGKLKKRPQHSSELEDQIIGRLIELKLLDDEAYVRRTLESAAHFKHEGYLKVASKLTHKGIPLDQTRDAWHELDLPEKEIARAALAKAQKRFQSLPREKIYQKKVQFLAARGFDPSIIFELAKEHDTQ
jgi:SOS response regulatory protein OraA/RecX